MDDRDPFLPRRSWQRLHPLTPVARIGRLVPALVLLAFVSAVHSKVENRTAETDYLVILTLGSAVYGYVHWMVTRWRFEGDTLRIETGLIRKDSRRLPLARDPGRRHRPPARWPACSACPSCASAWRVRDRPTAGSPTCRKRRRPSSGWSCWPGTSSTEVLASSNTGLPMAAVTTGRLLGSVLLSLVSVILVGTVAALVDPRPVRAAGRPRPPRGSWPSTC